MPFPTPPIYIVCRYSSCISICIHSFHLMCLVPVPLSTGYGPRTIDDFSHQLLLLFHSISITVWPCGFNTVSLSDIDSSPPIFERVSFLEAGNPIAHRRPGPSPAPSTSFRTFCLLFGRIYSVQSHICRRVDFLSSSIFFQSLEHFAIHSSPSNHTVTRKSNAHVIYFPYTRSCQPNIILPRDFLGLLCL